MGGEGDRADVAGEAARRPRRRARPRRRPQPRPRRPPAQPEDDAADRGVGDDLRRVRLLRAGLPEPQPDDDAAPADRPAARDGAPAGRARRCSGRCWRSTSTTALETCAADGSCQLACPVGIDTGKLVKELRQERHTRAGRSGWRWRRRSAGGRSRAARAALRLGGPLARRTKRGRALPGAGPGRLPATMHPRADQAVERRPPAPTASSEPPPPAVYVPSCTNRHLRPGARSRRWSRSRRAPGCRSGFPTTSPAAAAGCPGARKASATRTGTRRTRWSSGSGAGAARGRCRS